MCEQFLQNQVYDYMFEDKNLVPNLMVLTREQLAHAKQVLDALPPNIRNEVQSKQVLAVLACQ